MKSKVLDRIADPELRVYAVWVPMLQPPTELLRDAAFESKKYLDDPRVTNFVDSNQYTTKAFAPVLGIAKIQTYQPPAWDVYMVYDPAQTWTSASGAPPGSPPKPAFWQHQLSLNAPKELKLNGDRLREQVIAANQAIAPIPANPR